ncbi:MAG: pantetheine-phosphate adenylyltransferase [Chitinivibrionales bacterium]|nr:pantetheine-phosphate adenylyltransferase [Chitinivibrionales bacterium]
MPTAIYPGTFDPITFGHIDIARRASKIFTRVIAVIAENPKKNPTFSVKERVAMAQESLKNFKNISVMPYKGLIANCIQECKASAIIRGLRAISDFEYEFQMAFTNRKMSARAETVFLMPNEKYTYLNSTMVKEIARLGGDVSNFVPEYVERKMRKKLKASGA